MRRRVRRGSKATSSSFSARPTWARCCQARPTLSDGPAIAAGDADRAPLITHPDKVVCVGVNHRDHIEEMGHEVPDAPTYFAKCRRALIGARDDIAPPSEAMDAIAGFSVIDDVSVRDYQRRTGAAHVADRRTVLHTKINRIGECVNVRRRS